MTVKPRVVVIVFLCALGLGMRTDLSYPQTTPSLTVEAERMDALAASRGENRVIDTLSLEFSSFLGTQGRALIASLKSGAPVRLSRTMPAPTPKGPPITTITTINFSSPGKMRFGDAFIALALARAELASLDVTQPTPEQLRAVLMGGAIRAAGGTTAQLPGILILKSHKMGWGLISENLGLKLGPVVSALKSANHALMAGAASPTGEGTTDGDGSRAGTASEAVW